MAILKSFLYAFITFLGLSKRQDVPPTESTYGNPCPRLKVRDGFYMCYYHSDPYCEILCDRKYQGTFNCTSEGYKPDLPDCAEINKDNPDSPIECGKNEKYVPCVNQCNKCVKPRPEMCSERCIPGCDCIDGYTRNEDFVCVRRRECGKTEKYEDEACDKKCDKLCGMTDLRGHCVGEGMYTCECY